MKSFKTESKKIMEMMINSIYTNKEIFLRELISNASDALDKLYYESLTNGVTGIDKNDLAIKIVLNKENRTLTISDNGIGMDRNSLENNLGTIAKSGSEDFKNSMKDAKDVSIIGQFGVGFYSSFMVAEKVEVISKALGADKAYKWTSSGVEGYDIEECEKADRGTDIILHIKPNTETENYDVYLDEWQIRSLIKKYSDFIKYAIKLEVSKTEKDADGKEVTKKEFETINTMLPLWRKNKKDITQDEYDKFYTSMFYDYEKPLKVIHLNLEGRIEFRALLFIPQKAPYDFYTKEYEKGLKLYTNGVLITDKCANLLPDYLSFVKGVVDADLPLNVSRETLQDSKEVKFIADAIENKVLDALKDMLQNDRANYEKFYDAFGLQFKYSIYKSYGMAKDKLQDLLMYYSVKQDKQITLKEYVDAKPQDQDKILYASGKSVEAIKMLPQVDMSVSAGHDVLCLTNDFDEFAIKFLGKYNDLEIVNVTSEKFDDQEKTDDSNKELVEFLKETLKDKVGDVKLTTKLNNFPVALSTEGELSLEMERVLNSQAVPEKANAKRVLKIKTDSDVFEKIKTYFANDKEKLKDIANLLYAEAELISGANIENTAEVAKLLNKLI